MIPFISINLHQYVKVSELYNNSKKEMAKGDWGRERPNKAEIQEPVRL